MATKAAAAAAGSSNAAPLRVRYDDAESSAAATLSSSSSSRRVFVHPATLRSFNAQAGTAVAVILTVAKEKEDGSLALVADVWPRSSLGLDELCVPGWLLPRRVSEYESGMDTWYGRVTSLKSAPPTAHAVRLEMCLEDGASSHTQTPEDRTILEACVRDVLLARKYVFPTQYINVVSQECRHRFKVAAIERSEGEQAIKLPQVIPTNHLDTLQETAQLGRSTHILLNTSNQKPSPAPIPQSETAYAALGGLDAQVEEVRQLVEMPLRHPELFREFGLKPPRGLLLFGPPGTGKTTLAHSAAKACASSIITISGPELSSSLHGGTERALRKVFAQARQSAPSVIIIDEIDALAPRRDGESADVEKRVVASLLTLLDGLSRDDARVVIIAATNRPNALDPALRRPGRLDKEIEVGIPSSDARLSILSVLLHNVPHTLSDEHVRLIASQTHGYVGADLSSLVREAGMRALRRHMAEASELGPRMEQLSLQSTEKQEGVRARHGVGVDDFNAARATIRPSAMREITLEMPKVSWNDIAPGESGLHVQQRVRECVEWPLKYRDTMQALGIDPPRGVLLYGPPGCSKTLIARALASESGLNFVAVKGPELLNKYVGESERALREVFRKARAASPAIIFFDEIDGMTTTRGADDGGGAGDKLIATLLNEMDGVEQLSNVLVVAATNRPDVLDPALLRPGRLDRLLYVGPPDLEARRQILRIRTRHMAVADDVRFDALAEMTEGCSGAEVVYVCQDAGLRAMNEDVDAQRVSGHHFEAAARAVRRRITPAMLRGYEAWRDQATA